MMKSQNLQEIVISQWERNVPQAIAVARTDITHQRDFTRNGTS